MRWSRHVGVVYDTAITAPKIGLTYCEILRVDEIIGNNILHSKNTAN